MIFFTHDKRDDVSEIMLEKLAKSHNHDSLLRLFFQLVCKNARRDKATAW